MAHCPEGVAVSAAVDAEFSASAQVRQNETQRLFVFFALASRLGQVCPKLAWQTLHESEIDLWLSCVFSHHRQPGWWLRTVRAASRALIYSAFSRWTATWTRW